MSHMSFNKTYDRRKRVVTLIKSVIDYVNSIDKLESKKYSNYSARADVDAQYEKDGLSRTISLGKYSGHISGANEKLVLPSDWSKELEIIESNDIDNYKIEIRTHHDLWYIYDGGVDKREVELEEWMHFYIEYTKGSGQHIRFYTEPGGNAVERLAGSLNRI